MDPATWPAAEVVRRAVSDLVPYARNARTHTKAQVAKIAASIREWGWTNPVLVDERGTIIAGHGRVLAAQLLGVREVPCVVARGWTAEQKRAYSVADNQIALDAGWDRDLLRVELGELADRGFDLGLIGFDDLPLKALLAGDQDLQDVVEQHVGRPDAPVSRRGDLWHLGRHRLLCGDATAEDDVRRLLGDAVPFLMVTDPPYGVDYDPAWRHVVGVNRSRRVVGDDRADWREAWRLFPGNVAYVWHAGRLAAVVAESLGAAEFEIRAQVVWSKSRHAISRGHYHWRHEPCLYAVRDSAKLTKAQEREMLDEVRRMIDGDFGDDHVPCWYAFRPRKGGARWIGGRRQSTVWEIASSDDGDDSRHGTQKPLECMGRPMRNHDAEVVYDPFVGTGTSIVAAEVLGRTCLAMELDPAWVDVCVERWQNRTGQVAVLDSGESLDDMRKARAG